jgi:ribosome maturation factor RimP
MTESDVDKVLELAAPIAGEYGLEVLEITLKGSPPRRMLRVTLDSPTVGRAVTLDDCTTVSRRLGDVLEAHDAVAGGYLLEVSSPGVNRPLRTAEQFARVVGQRVRVRFRHPVEGTRGVLARLGGIDGERIRLECEDGSVVEASMGEVERANLEYEFESPKKPAGGGKRRRHGKK